MASRVVIGYDGSEASEDAVAFGLTWSRSTGDVPIVATVYPEEHPFGLGVRRVDIDWVTYVRPANPSPADALLGSRPIVGGLFLPRRQNDEQAFVDRMRDSFGKALEFAATGVSPELKPQTVLLEGAAVESLAGLGPDDVDLLVCGSRGYGPARRVLLGGVSSRLIRRAQLPVAVVPRATTTFAE